jgi:excisionase family DNA binding protein
MEWRKVKPAAVAWAGGISDKAIYAAIRSGKLRAARYGAGRNYLLCKEWIDDWLVASAEAAHRAESDRPVEMRARRRA